MQGGDAPALPDNLNDRPRVSPGLGGRLPRLGSACIEHRSVPSIIRTQEHALAETILPLGVAQCGSMGENSFS